MRDDIHPITKFDQQAWPIVPSAANTTNFMFMLWIKIMLSGFPPGVKFRAGKLGLLRRTKKRRRKRARPGVGPDEKNIN